MFEIPGDKELLIAMVGAVLQDLRPPPGLTQDPMPMKSASDTEYQAWIERHTSEQRRAEKKNYTAGDDIYNHYTARAILGGMPFNARDRQYTLSGALVDLGLKNPEKLIAGWRADAESAAETGDRIMVAINGKALSRTLMSSVMLETEEEEDSSDSNVATEDMVLPCEAAELVSASAYPHTRFGDDP